MKKLFFWGCIFLVFFSPLIYCAINLSLAYFTYRRTAGEFKKGHFLAAGKNASFLSESLDRVYKMVHLGRPAFKLVGLDRLAGKTENLFLLGKVLGEGTSVALGAMDQGQETMVKFFQGEKVDTKKTTAQIQIALGKAEEKAIEAQVLFDHFSGKEFIVGGFILTGKREVSAGRILLRQSRDFLKILPRLFPEKERRVYLFLLQNNMELRPTGGFIGSFGILTLENGLMLDFEIFDAYEADGQLKGHVEPPLKLKEFLGQAGWYLRDSNWDPDFPTSAARAEWFLEKEIGRRTDGVIGLNLAVAQKLLDVFGEIEVTDYQEKINANNFFEKAQYYNEVGFFAGSKAKKDFLGAVINVLFEKTRRIEQKDVFRIAQAFFQSLNEKDMMIFANDNEVRNTLAELNWDGGIKMASCKEGGPSCFKDYLMIVEANVGVNKANYFLQRNLSLETKIDEKGWVEKSLTINYANNSPSALFPGGDYKNYLRLYVTPGSMLVSCQIKEETVVDPCRTDETEENQKKIIGFFLNVPFGKKKEVRVSWLLEKKFNAGFYRFFWQKQSGLASDPLSLVFAVEPDWAFVDANTHSLTNQNPLRYNTSLSQDKIFDLDIRQVK